MKAFEELTYRGRIRRMRQVAQEALSAYGLADPQLSFLRQAGNTLFLVKESSPSITGKAEVYKTGQYMLRIHEPGYQTSEAIELELAWLAAMGKDADLPVPEPVARLDGSLLTQVYLAGVPGERNCSLLRWVKGREVKKENVRPYHYQAQGRLMARMHNHAAKWKPPAGLSKRKLDWEGLFQEDSGSGMPASEAWSLLPPEYLQLFEEVTRKVGEVMEAWGKGPEVYGLIHGDLGIDANLLFRGREAVAIDFDDSGFGYYLYDLSIALEHCQEDELLPIYREALLDGYRQFRSLPEDATKYLDLFLAAFCVYLSLWAAAMAHLYPRYQEELGERMKRALWMVKEILGRV